MAAAAEGGGGGVAGGGSYLMWPAIEPDADMIQYLLYHTHRHGFTIHD